MALRGRKIDNFDDISLAAWLRGLPICVSSTSFQKSSTHQKSIVLLISDTFSVGGCWGQPMLLFWKLGDKTQMSIPCDHAARDIPSKFSIFLPLRAIYFRSYQSETPCKKFVVDVWIWDSKKGRMFTKLGNSNSPWVIEQ